VSAVGPKNATFAEVRFHPNADTATIFRYKNEQTWTAGANNERFQALRAREGQPRVAEPNAATAGSHSFFARKDEATGQWVHAHDTDQVHAHDAPTPAGRMATGSAKAGEPAKVVNDYHAAKAAEANTPKGKAEAQPGAREKPVEVAKKSGAEHEAAARELTKPPPGELVKKMTGEEHARAEQAFKDAAKAYRAEGNRKDASRVASLASNHATVGAFRRAQEAKAAEKSGGGDQPRDEKGQFAPK
jgi:hypothetical protein